MKYAAGISSWSGPNFPGYDKGVHDSSEWTPLYVEVHIDLKDVAVVIRYFFE